MSSSSPRRFVLAPDKFKGSASADEVSHNLRVGIAKHDPVAEVVEFPVADGGEGTLDAVERAGYTRRRIVVEGPLGNPVSSSYAVRGDTAVVELADACGLGRLTGPQAPFDASSIGAGQAVAAAIRAGCTRVIVGLGGSASTDGGVGFLHGLGAEFLDSRGQGVPRGARGLEQIARVNLDPVVAALSQVELIVASDVDNPLVGPTGAARVYGPQKGAAEGDIDRLEGALRHLVAMLPSHVAVHAASAGAGAAGGVGFGALVAGGAVRPGAGLLLDLLGFDAVIADADLVVTGEGSFDAQSAHGKAPVGVRDACFRRGVLPVLVCGRLGEGVSPVEFGFAKHWALSDRATGPVDSMSRTPELLQTVGMEISSWAR